MIRSQIFTTSLLPVGLRGLVVAALFAAAMSTIDSGANSISTIITVDFFRRLGSSGRSARSELVLARTLTATMGLVIVAATIGLYYLSKGGDLISLMQKGFNCFLGPLGGLFVLLPLILFYLLLAEMLELVVALATPIADLFPKRTFDQIITGVFI